jgi:hypothetical protein
MSNDEIYNTNPNPSSTEDIIELGAYLLAGLFAGKHIQNKIVDHNRREFLDKLPMQNLGRWVEQDLRGFYRNKKFYVTQFPDTHPEVFPHASKLLYALIKFHGNRRESVMGRWQLQSQVNSFIRTQARVLGADSPQWRDGNILKLTQHNPNWNLAKFLNSPEIRDLIFSVKKDKRIDVAIYQAKIFGRIEKIEELNEEDYNLSNLYNYLVNSDFILHIYDIPSIGNFSNFVSGANDRDRWRYFEENYGIELKKKMEGYSNILNPAVTSFVQALVPRTHERYSIYHGKDLQFIKENELKIFPFLIDADEFRDGIIRIRSLLSQQNHGRQYSHPNYQHAMIGQAFINLRNGTNWNEDWETEYNCVCFNRMGRLKTFLLPRIRLNIPPRTDFFDFIVPSDFNSIFRDEPYASHTEKQYLEHLLESWVSFPQINHDALLRKRPQTNIRGLIFLGNHREPCDSCQRAIDLFEQLFPNIVILHTQLRNSSIRF